MFPIIAQPNEKNPQLWQKLAQKQKRKPQMKL